MTLTHQGAFATDVRPARKPLDRKQWAKDRSQNGAEDGTRLDATFVNDLAGLILNVLETYDIAAAEGDDSLLVLAIEAAITAALVPYLAFTDVALDTDGMLAGNSDEAVASQKATKTYVDAIVAANDAMVFKGVVDASANPNYPAADRGWTYRISVAGKIGGGSGPNVEVGDIIICLTDGTLAGDHATVGASWAIIQTNLDGAVIGPASATDGDFAQYDGTTGKLLKGGLSLDTDGALAANSDSRIASQKAVKTYADTKIGGTAGGIDNRLVRADGGGGKTIQSTGIAVDDTDNVSGVASIAAALMLETGIITPAQITADQNDYAPTNGAASGMWRLDTDAARDITGIGSPAAGARHALINVGSFIFVLKHEDAASVAANRFALAGGIDLAVNPGETALIWYDTTSSRWRALAYPTAGSVQTTRQVLAGGIATGGGDLSTDRTITVTGATQAEMEAASSTAKAVTPGVVRYHPGVAKAWLKFAGDFASVLVSYGVTSLTDNGPGDGTINFNFTWSSIEYCAVAGAVAIGNIGTPIIRPGSQNSAGAVAELAATTTSIRITSGNTAATFADLGKGNVAFYGDQ